jgi:hypothetical protein
MTEKFVGVGNKGNYYEFRVVGNKDYEYRFGDIKKVITQIKRAMNKSLKKELIK